MTTIDQMLRDPVRMNKALRDICDARDIADAIFPVPPVLHRRSGLRLRLYRGVHRRNRFSITVADIKAAMQPWELEPGKWMTWTGPVFIPGQLGPEPGVLAIHLTEGQTAVPVLLADMSELGMSR